jgi:uncharacterized integral membrane protein
MLLALVFSFRLGAVAALAVDIPVVLAAVAAAAATTSVGLRFLPWAQLRQLPLALVALRSQPMQAATSVGRQLLAL